MSPALEAQSLIHWTARDVPADGIFASSLRTESLDCQVPCREVEDKSY